MKISLRTLLFTFSVSFTVFGQSEEMWIALKIVEVNKSMSPMVLTIEGGTEVGLQPGHQGEAYQVARSGRNDKLNYTGKITFISAVSGRSTAQIETVEDISVGDLAFVKATIKSATKTTSFYLAIYGIEFTDKSGNPYYSLSEVLQSNGQKLEKDRLLTMQQEINDEGSRLKISDDQQQVKEGRNKGKPVSTVMIETDTTQIKNFLSHTLQDYEVTTGQTYSLISQYSRYVADGDWITPAELKSYFKIADSARWEIHFKNYRRRINTELVNEWIKESKELKNNEHYVEASNLFQACIFLLRKMEDHYNAALCLYEVAVIYSDNLKDYKGSLRWFSFAQVEFEKAGSLLGEGYAFHYIALTHEHLSNPKVALHNYQEAARVREQLLKSEPDNSTYAVHLLDSYIGLAGLYKNDSDFDSALKYYQLGLEVTKAYKLETQQADLLWNIGFCYDRLGKHTEAISWYQLAIPIYYQVKDSSSVVELKRNVAIQYKKLNDLKNARQTIADGIAIARSWGKPDKLAYLLDYQGSLSYDTKDYGQAITSYRESVTIYSQLGDKDMVINRKKDLLEAYKEARQFDEAINLAKERIALIDKKDTSALADAYWTYALIFTDDYKKEPRKAIELYKQSEVRFLALKDTGNLVSIINNTALQYKLLNDSTNAYKLHERALSLTAKSSQQLKQADTYDRYGATTTHFKNQVKTISLYTSAMNIYLQMNDYLMAGNVVEKMGDLYQSSFDFDKSSGYYIQSIDLYGKAGDKKQVAESYWAWGYNLGQKRLYDEGIEKYRVAYRIYMEEADSVDASVMLSNIGQVYWSKLEYQKAIESHKAAIELATQCKNYKQVASSWTKLATLYKSANNPVASSEALSKALEALNVVSDSLLLAGTYNDLAESYSSLKDFNRAFTFYDKAIVISKNQRDTIKWSSYLYNMGSAYQNKNDFKRAEVYYQQALSLQKKIGDKSGIIYTYLSLGSTAQSVNINYKQSEIYYREAEKLARDLKDDILLAFCYVRIKGLYRLQGKSALADDYITKALAIYQNKKQWKEVARTLTDIGYEKSYVYGDNVSALNYLDQAQQIADTLNDVTTLAIINNSRSSVFQEMGEFAEALSLSNKSLQLYQQLDSDWGIAGSCIEIGNIYKQMTEYATALRYQQKADSIYKQINFDYSRMAPLANMGLIYTSQGDYKKGLEYYEQSYAIMKQANDLNENVSIIQGAIGESYFYLDNYAEADKWMKEALTTSDKVGAVRPKTDILSVIGRLKVEEKKYDEAYKYLSEGVRISREKGMKVSYLGNINIIGQLEVIRKNYSKAKPILEECVQVSREIGKNSTLWESLYWLGILYKENNQLPQSSEYLKEAITVIEKIRNNVSGGDEAQKLFSSDKYILKVYEALVDVLLKQGETDLALSYIQKNNEDNLKAKFKSLDIKFENDGKNKAVEQERGMKSKLDGLEKQIANEKALPAEKQNMEKLKRLEGIKTVAETDYLKFVNQQVNVRPELSKYFNNSVQPAQLKGKKKQIPKDMALLSYLPGESQLYIFVATSDTVLAKVVNVTRAQLTRNINAVLNVVRTNQGTFDKLSIENEVSEREEVVLEMKQSDAELKPFEELYQYMIAPAGAEIAGKKRLCIIPNGSLSYVPFQLLGKTLQNGKFSLLMNQYSIFYANSTDMLLRVAENETRQFKILAFGNPDKTLPSTEKEVVEIKSLFPNSSIFLREDATEDKAKYAGEEFNVMHFATHGNLDYEDFGKSFLTMAGNPSKDEDGLLTLEELWGMDVMSHLNIVVLSACQTAVSKGSDESSPVSPASGFLQNGVKSVVATLWKVDDEATSILMQDFYKNIKTMDAVDALRMAQIHLSNNQKFSHPYYWAAPVLLGDWR